MRCYICDMDDDRKVLFDKRHDKFVCIYCLKASLPKKEERTKFVPFEKDPHLLMGEHLSVEELREKEDREQKILEKRISDES